MADSREAIAFRGYFDRLQTGLQNNLNDITPRLFARGLISDSNHRRVLSGGTSCVERANHLVTVLLDGILTDPTSFHQIIVELETCPVLQVLAKGLKEELGRVRKEAPSEQQRLHLPTCALVSLWWVSVASLMELGFVNTHTHFDLLDIKKMSVGDSNIPQLRNYVSC